MPSSWKCFVLRRSSCARVKQWRRTLGDSRQVPGRQAAHGMHERERVVWHPDDWQLWFDRCARGNAECLRGLARKSRTMLPAEMDRPGTPSCWGCRGFLASNLPYVAFVDQASSLRWRPRRTTCRRARPSSFSQVPMFSSVMGSSRLELVPTRRDVYLVAGP